MIIPIEIVDNICNYLPLEKIPELSEYQFRKIYKDNTTKCNDYIIRNGFLWILVWVKERNLLTEPCINIAAKYNQLDIIKWVYSFKEKVIVETEVWELLMSSKDHKSVFEYLYSIKITEKDVYTLHFINEFIVRNEKYDIIQWICKKFPITVVDFLLHGFFYQDIYIVEYVLDKFSYEDYQKNNIKFFIQEYILKNDIGDIINNQCLKYMLDFQKIQMSDHLDNYVIECELMSFFIESYRLGPNT